MQVRVRSILPPISSLTRTTLNSPIPPPQHDHAQRIVIKIHRSRQTSIHWPVLSVLGFQLVPVLHYVASWLIFVIGQLVLVISHPTYRSHYARRVSYYALQSISTFSPVIMSFFQFSRDLFSLLLVIALLVCVCVQLFLYFRGRGASLD